MFILGSLYWRGNLISFGVVSPPNRSEINTAQTHLHTNTLTHTNTFTHTHKHTHTHIHTHTHTHIHAYTHNTHIYTIQRQTGRHK